MSKLLGWLAAGGMALALASCAPTTTPRATIPQAAGTGDRAVLEGMAHYHWEAHRMAQACKEQTRRAELVGFCNTLLSEHRQALQDVLGFLQQWYGQTLQPERSAEHGSEQYRAFHDEMKSSSGEKFDEAFLRAMRVHHRLGFKEANGCRTQAAHQQLREFCEKEAAGHGRELRVLDGLICKWFRDCIGVSSQRE